MSIYPTTGKTLILEASVKTLQRENTKVFFVNALGKTLQMLSLIKISFWTDYYVDGRYLKKSDDILDAISR